MNELEKQLATIIFFQLFLLIGISLVSIHYRNKFEKLKSLFTLNNYRVKECIKINNFSL